MYCNFDFLRFFPYDLLVSSLHLKSFESVLVVLSHAAASIPMDPTVPQGLP